MDVKNKVVVITGASEGIGLATAQLLAKNGATVVLAARSADKIFSEATAMLSALAVPTDMRKSEDIKNLFDQTIAKFGRIDILINNAGQGIYGPVEKIDLNAYREVMELNLFAVVEAMQQIIPIMRKQGGGMILNISSRVSKNYFPGLAAYASTKYALNCISLTARQELEPDKIIVSVMHPKMTATKFGVHAIGGRQDDSRATGQAAPNVDTADDVARKILELIGSEQPEAVM